MKYGAIATGWVGTCEVHGIRASCRGTLPDIAVVPQGEEHEVVVEIVLPHESLGFQRVGGETHIAGESFTKDLDVSPIGTFQRYDAAAPVVNGEFRLFALVTGMGVVEQAVLECYSRFSRGFVNDAERLAAGDVAAAIGTRLIHGEVVEFGITTFLSIFVEYPS